MKLSLLCCIAAVLLPGSDLSAQTITMDSFLESVKEKHPLFEREQLSPQIQSMERESYLGAQDWTVFSTPYYTYQELLATSSFSPEKVQMAGASVGVEKAFWSTGGRLSLSWSSDYTDQDVPDIVIPIPPDPILIPAGASEFYQHKAYLTYTQPLLQNRGGYLDRLSYELGTYSIDMTHVQSIENEEAFILDLGMRFLDWVLLEEQRRIAGERLRLAEEQLAQIRRRRAANLIDRVDVLRAEDAVHLASQGVMLVESQRKSKQTELAVLAQSGKIYEQSPEFDIYGLESLPEPDQVVHQLGEKSRILKALSIRRNQLSHLKAGFSERSRPQVFLSVGAGLQGGAPEFGSALELDKPDLLVGLNFRYPLGARTARSEMARTDIEIEQVEKDIEKVSLDLEAAVRNLLMLINEFEGVLLIDKERIESAKAKTKEELRLYNQGRGILTFVIQSRDSEQQAKLTYAQNAASYHNLVLRYRALVDELHR
jgi:outer membrane protein TolC